MSARGFSVKGLLASVALLAVACAAVFNASQVWVSILSLLTALLLLTAIVGVIYGSGRHRAFAVGCFVCGWGYLLVAYAPEPYDIIDTFVLHTPANMLYRTMPLPPDEVSQRDWAGVVDSDGQPIVVLCSPIEAVRVGRLLFAWLFAAVGGFTALYLRAKRDGERALCR